MRRMFKYELPPDQVPEPGQTFSAKLPVGAVVRAVERQGSIFGHGLMVWAEVDPDAELVVGEFTRPVQTMTALPPDAYNMIPTGGAIPEKSEYRGTITDPLGLVFHIYEPSEHVG